MDKSNKDDGTQLPDINNSIKKKYLKNQRSFKIKMKMVNFPLNYKTINNFNHQNTSSKKDTKIKIKNFRRKTKTEFFKIKDFNFKKKLIYQYDNKTDETNHKNNFDSNDLKRFTNNSNNYKIFNGLNNPFHTYSVNKIEKLSFLKFKSRNKNANTNTNKVISLNNLKLLLFNNSKNSKNNYSRNNNLNIDFSTYKKEMAKLFVHINPIKIPLFLNKNSEKDLEERDVVDIHIFENFKLKKSIRNSLLNDINQNALYYKLFLNFLKSITNRINFVEDIYLIPHIKNNFALSKPFENFELLTETLRNKNLLHKQVSISMNRSCIVKELLIKKEEIDMRRKEKEIEYNPKKKPKYKDYINLYLSDYDQQYEPFELSDFFGKCINYSNIYFANDRLKNLIFSDKFTKET